MWLLKLILYVIAANVAVWASVYGVIRLTQYNPWIGLPACVALMGAMLSLLADFNAASRS